MKRVLLTGATGFVGANLARRLLEDGHEVHLLLRQGFRNWRLADVWEDLSHTVLELHDPEAVGRAMEQFRPDWVFHLAASGAYPTQNDAQEMVRTNVQGTLNLLESCRRCGCGVFVNTGSSSEYGFKNHPPAETEFLEPNSYYAATKAAGTLLSGLLGRQFGLNTCTLRLYSIYGPYEEPTRLIPTLVMKGLEGSLPVMASPETSRDFVYVDDCVEAFLLAAQFTGQHGGATYNLGSGRQMNLGEVVEVTRRVFGISAEAEWNTMPGRKWDTSCWVADNRLITQVLGWVPRTDFEAGFRRTAEWFRADDERVALYQRIRES